LAETKTTSAPASDLAGTWCTGEEGMMLSFFGKDSLKVTSTSDESMQGNGRYSFTDSTISATVTNGELFLKMNYLYRRQGTDTVTVKTTLFTINDEAVEYPDEWILLWRCGKETVK
jgi:hypothetical protein